MRIVDIESCLDGGEVGRSGLEGGIGATELIVLRPVFCVVDHEIVATRERQSVVERLGFCAWSQVRHNDNLKARRQRKCPRGRHRFGVRRLETQFDIEFDSGPVEALERVDKLRQHVRLAVERHEDGVGRQEGVGVVGQTRL